MKVSDLIAELQTYPQDMEVMGRGMFSDELESLEEGEVFGVALRFSARIRSTGSWIWKDSLDAKGREGTEVLVIY